MASKRGRGGRRPRRKAQTAEYADAERGTLILRCDLSQGSIRKLREDTGNAAATTEDVWQRQTEMLFERLAVSWTIAGLPITDQKTLLGRYRMATADERQWVRETIAAHVAEHIPELRGS